MKYNAAHQETIAKFVYFLHNFKVVTYNGRLIPKILVDIDWPCGLDHILRMWDNYIYEDTYLNSLIRLYVELDTEHRNLMADYIQENQTV